MKRVEALALQEGDLVDVKAPGWQGGKAYGRKVLLVSSKGGVYVAGDSWGLGERWTRFHYVVALGRREALTEKERASQLRECERFQAGRERLRRETRESYLRNRTPQALYDFVWDELEGSEGCALEALQAKAKARGLQADATTWRRIGRVLKCNPLPPPASGPQFWRLRGLDVSVLVMPRRLSDQPPAAPLGQSGAVMPPSTHSWRGHSAGIL